MQSSASSDRRDFLKTAGAVGAGAVAATSATEETLAASGSLEVDSFSRYLDSEFTFSTGGSSYFKAKLSEVTASPRSGHAGHRQPFSLLFTAPKQVKVNQDAYTVSHPTLGRMQLLIVPVDGLANETRLQAVFG